MSMVLIEAQFEHICSQLGQGLLTGPAAELALRQAARRMPSEQPLVEASQTHNDAEAFDHMGVEELEAHIVAQASKVTELKRLSAATIKAEVDKLQAISDRKRKAETKIEEERRMPFGWSNSIVRAVHLLSVPWLSALRPCISGETLWKEHVPDLGVDRCSRALTTHQVCCTS